MLNHRKKTDYISWTILIGVLLLAIEISFFHQGLIFSLLVSGAFVYIGRKKWHSMIGKILFWLGIIQLVFNVFTMMTARFFLLAILLYVLIQFFQSKRQPALLQPKIQPADRTVQTEILERKPLLQNLLFGRQKTPEQAYEWNDVNIQVGLGDTVIDLSYAVLPKGEAVISIRHWIGNVQIFVPYELEISIVHSAVVGSTLILDKEKEQIFNQTLVWQTTAYETAEQKLKIITSMMVGNLEVKRI
ncbi:hypothetical protein AT864_03352 [Anoxybacillus sp. P3H1B]|uniref:cell wall-active antibiotics response protein LiaF n=1 Tax=Anoxybacillaceae TaxID=3120669 RepID=UPI0007911BB5|nr:MULTISPECIES: cell wall-active antibiotics response protein LiaF [Anoxybacillus]KXG08404.1 hypothetical protein AT864_03352 [Anoxybacillus sp. P3H1B]MBB3908685.1 lia operon protein LiaF [Anoxybacillus rupiensis]MBS2770325.1 cell wall-active antibiotics response protein [Anoxybacillus rupiensis]